MNNQLSTQVRRITTGKGNFNLSNSLELLLFAFVAVFLLIFGKRMYNSFKNGNSIFSIFSNKSGGDVVYNTISGSKQTITEANAKMLANRLENAMVGIGTNETEIYSIINNNLTQNDLIAITNAFGKRMYQAGAPAFLHKSMGFLSAILPKLDLIDWLKAELNEKEFSKIKPLFDKAKIK